MKRKDYLKIKASGYAWEVSNAEGIVSYIDGAGHRASNWLKFVNCCRGKGLEFLSSSLCKDCSTYEMNLREPPLLFVRII